MSEIEAGLWVYRRMRCVMLEVRLKMDEDTGKNVAEEETLGPDREPEGDVDVRSVLAWDPLLLLVAPEPNDEKEKDLWNTEREKVRIYLDQMSERDQLVIKSRYGIDGPIKSLEESAELLGVSRERARQIEKNAVMRFRQKWGRRWGCEFGTARRRFLMTYHGPWEEDP